MMTAAAATRSNDNNSNVNNINNNKSYMLDIKKTQLKHKT
jgi:hypothetical protein